MTKDDIMWLLSLVDESRSCFDCDIFEKCQEENRDYCEKEHDNDSIYPEAKTQDENGHQAP